MEQADQPGSNFIGFIYKNRDSVDIMNALPANLQRAVTSFHALLAPLLSDLPQPLRSHRIGQSQAFVLSAAADRERALADGRAVLPFEIEVSDLVDGLSAFLTAPMSPHMRSALRGVKTSASSGPLLI
jgi:hypothetical protein